MEKRHLGIVFTNRKLNLYSYIKLLIRFMKNFLLILPFIMLMTTPLAAQSLKKGDIQLIRPNEKRSTTPD